MRVDIAQLDVGPDFKLETNIAIAPEFLVICPIS